LSRELAELGGFQVPENLVRGARGEALEIFHKPSRNAPRQAFVVRKSPGGTRIARERIAHEIGAGAVA
jgi:hypothetical protein